MSSRQGLGEVHWSFYFITRDGRVPLALYKMTQMIWHIPWWPPTEYAHTAGQRCPKSVTGLGNLPSGEHPSERPFGFVKINKGTSVKIGVGKAFIYYHLKSITPNRKTSIALKRKAPIMTSTGRDIPCTPKQEMQLLYCSSRRKEDFFLAQQQA